MKIIMALAFVAVAVVSYAAGHLSLSNSASVKDATGVIECSANGVTIITDTVPAGFKFTGNLNYNGTVK